jgi:hypothetical protein
MEVMQRLIDRAILAPTLNQPDDLTAVESSDVELESNPKDGTGSNL